MKAAEEWGKAQECIVKPMRTFQESDKSKKTVSSMIKKKNEPVQPKKEGMICAVIRLVLDETIFVDLQILLQ